MKAQTEAVRLRRSTVSTLRIHFFREPLTSFCVAGSRTGQTISLSVVLATNVRDREIEGPGQLPTGPIQRIESRTAATVLAAHLLDHYFGSCKNVKRLGLKPQGTVERLELSN